MIARCWRRGALGSPAQAVCVQHAGVRPGNAHSRAIIHSVWVPDCVHYWGSCALALMGALLAAWGAWLNLRRLPFQHAGLHLGCF